MDTEKLLQTIYLQEKIIDKLEEREVINKAIIEKYEKLILLYESKMKSMIIKIGGINESIRNEF